MEWPDGRREACLFLLEEETDPLRFPICRLVSCCATVAELGLWAERVLDARSLEDVFCVQ